MLLKIQHKTHFLKNTFLLFSIYLVGITINAQIKVDETVLTVEQLVEDVLISSDCSEVSNIITTQGRSLKGVGYFTNNNIDFPFKSGVILSTGNVKNAEGPNTFPKPDSSAGAAGDLDLETAIPSLSEGQTADAVFIQFDFIPTSDFISFQFLLASDEYFADFPCRFSDAFAFLLTDSKGVTTNLATLPNSDEPIAVTSIHPAVSALENEYLGCAAKNEQFFDKIIPFETGAINFIGQTKVFTAKSDVTPNEKYTIKLVLADALDEKVPTAVFLLEGSFNIGADLGADLTIANGTAICESGPNRKVLDPNFKGNKGTYSWQKLNATSRRFETIPNENNGTYLATEDGTYKVIFSASEACSFEDTVVIEFIENVPVANTINDIEQCDYEDTGKFDFDLTPSKLEVLGAQNESNFNVTFHYSQNAADENTNPIGMNIETDEQTIFARIENKQQGSCYQTTSFNVKVLPITKERGRSKIEGFGKVITVCVDAEGNLVNPLSLGTPVESIEQYIWLSDNDASVTNNTNATYEVTQLTQITDYTLRLIPRNNTSCFVFEYTTRIIPVGPPINAKSSTENPILSEKFTVTTKVDETSIGKENYLYQLNDEEPQKSNIFTDLEGGDYTIKILAFAGKESCSNSVPKPITLINFPKSFSPNNDGINDNWNIKQLDQEPFIIYIYNRFGKLMKTINTQGNGWDGTYNNAKMPSDEYWFIFDYKNPESPTDDLINYKGHFTLKR